MAKPDGTIVEANHVGCKLEGQYVIKYTDGRIEKGLMKNNKRHGTWTIYVP